MGQGQRRSGFSEGGRGLERRASESECKGKLLPAPLSTQRGQAWAQGLKASRHCMLKRFAPLAGAYVGDGISKGAGRVPVLVPARGTAWRSETSSPTSKATAPAPWSALPRPYTPVAASEAGDAGGVAALIKQSSKAPPQFQTQMRRNTHQLLPPVLKEWLPSTMAKKWRTAAAAFSSPVAS